VWARDSRFVYFVKGTLPDQLDVWRIRPNGGPAERITSHNGRVTHPVLLNERTLMYLASDPDGTGPWLHSIDVERRLPHRLSAGVDQFTSLAANADGTRLVATVARPKRTLWRVRIGEAPAGVSAAERISLTTGTGISPRLGPDYLLYVSSAGASSDRLWKLAGGASTQLWSMPGGQIVGGPAITADGRHVAISVRLRNQTILYVLEADGTKARVVTDALDLQGAPAWAPDGKSITSAVFDRGTPRLFRIPLDGGAPSQVVAEYSVDPAWSPDGRFVVFSGPDIGTAYAVKAVTAAGAPHQFPTVTLRRGARHLAFLRGRPTLVFLRGDLQHKNVWLLDLETSAERQLTDLTADFIVRDFDISPDGRELVLEREQEHSDIVLLDLPRE
jgi:Tol biopolymer transport system component